MKHPARLVVLAILLLAVPIRAQAPAPSRAEALALELLEVSGVRQTLATTMESFIDTQIGTNPAIAPFRETMLDWAAKAMRWEEIGPKMAALYVEVFSEEELAALVEFQRTPLAAKMREKQPELTRRGMEIGAASAMRHKADLERMIREKQAQMEREAEQRND
jgi:hypothetical protein